MNARTTSLLAALIVQCFVANEEAACFQGTPRRIRFHELTTLGGDEKNPFIEAGMVAAGPSGSVYVTEKMRQLINQYDSTGKMVLQLREEERRKAGFRVGPYQIATSRKNVAAVDFGSRVIKLFDLELHFLEDIIAPGSVMDISFLSDDFLYIAFITNTRNGVLTKYSLRTRDFAHIPLRNASGGSFFDMNSIEADVQGRLVVAYTYKNRIELIGSDARPLHESSIPGLKDSASLIVLNDGRLVEQVPEGTMFQDLALGPQGIIFLLGGDVAEIPHQTLYALNHAGDLLFKGSLPKPSGLMYIDRNGYMYTREDRKKTIRKYRIDWSGF